MFNFDGYLTVDIFYLDMLEFSLIIRKKQIIKMIGISMFWIIKNY